MRLEDVREFGETVRFVTAGRHFDRVTLADFTPPNLCYPASMTAITLPADLEAWARAEVAAGRAESVETLVADALSERRAEIEYVRSKLDEARASLARGEGVPLEDFLRRGGERVSRLRGAAKAAE